MRLSLRTGVIVAAVALALSLPGFAISVMFLDLSALLPPTMRWMAPYMTWGGLVFAFIFMLVGTAHLVLQVGLAGLASPERNAFPLLSRAPSPFRGWGWALLVGVVGGFGSALVFRAMDVKVGSAMEALLKMFPGLHDYPPVVLMFAFLPALLAAALTEEVLYRGVLQGWLTRLLGDGAAAAAFAILVTSALWAVAHAGNVSPMLPKLSQILLLGFALGAIARRYGVEASIVGHAVLNTAAVAAAVLLHALGKA